MSCSINNKSINKRINKQINKYINKKNKSSVIFVYSPQLPYCNLIINISSNDDGIIDGARDARGLSHSGRDLRIQPDVNCELFQQLTTVNFYRSFNTADRKQ